MDSDGIQLSNLALRHLVGELQFLVNGFVNNAQSLENGWVKVKVHTKLGDKNLVLTPNALFVPNISLPAKQNPGGFSALMKKYLYNQRIVSLKQHGLDRIVLFEFPEVFLIVELFAKGNIILCNKEMRIIKALRREEWKDRKLEQNEEYKFPSSKGVSPLGENFEDFYKKLRENKKTFFGACVDLLNVSPLILEKVFEDLKLNKKSDSEKIGEREAKKLLEGIKSVYSGKEEGVFLVENVIYSTKVSKNAEKTFENINSALNSLIFSGETKKEIKIIEKAEEKKRTNKTIKELSIKQNQIQGLEVQEKEAKEKGEKVYLHYAELKELFEALRKAKAKGLKEKEIIEKINSLKQIIKKLDLEKEKVVVEV